MRLAVIYNDNEVYAEFSPQEFKEMLKKYLAEYKDFDLAYDKVCEILRAQVIRR